ncbi:MAG: ATP-binding protein [Lachnospiraceae bacterium]|nr:ATP-binding protein [Lachnospiraceae bacterium]
MEKQINFKSRARLMPQIGDQLIKNESIALLELVKNSYDADAPDVWVEMWDVDKPKIGRIIVKDNGDGMDLSIVENSWMEIGTDNKKNLLDEYISNNKKSALGRLPMGEKGIGRFGVHKLGNKITLITRMKGKQEVVVKIDWTAFEKFDYLEQVPITVLEREPEYFLGEQKGTYIEITELKNEWTRGRLRDVYRSVMSLQSPFESIQSFNVEFDTNHEEWLEGLLTVDKIKNDALFFADVVIEGNEIIELKYEFKPWKVLNKLAEKQINRTHIEMCREERENNKKMLKSIDLSSFNIGRVRMKLMIFDLDNTILSYGVSDKKGLKEYLKNNGGIAVYRDNIRIYEYGESGNDWLQLESKRINAPGTTLSSKITIGAIYLDRQDSSGLVEKTNREGFVENEAFEEFRYAIINAIEKIQTLRNIDKDLLKKYYGPSGKAEPVLSSIEDLKIVVEKNIDDIKLRNLIHKSLRNIEIDYKNITDVYIRSASAGLSLSVVIHEIEKIIAELRVAIMDEQSTEHVKNLVFDLSKVTDGYASVIKSKKQSLVNVSELIDDALFNVKYRLKVHKIDVDMPYQEKKIKENIKCASNLVIGTIMNLVDNSIYWLTYSHIEDKKMYFDVSMDYEGFITIIVADNGYGFTLPTDQVIKPFVTDRVGGMGLGLHLADEIMKSSGGRMIFPDKGDVYLPEEFKRGAVVGLSFPIPEG